MKPLQDSVKASLEQATRVFLGAMTGSPAESYVESRGLSRATATDHRLGFVPVGVVGFERFAGTLAIPNICAAGHVVGFKFRSLDPDDEHKYDQPDGQVARLFNLRALNLPSTFIVLTEGEIDAMTLTGLGLPAVGIPGASAWRASSYRSRLFENYDTVLLIQDDDSAGSALAKELRGTDLPIRTARPPSGANDVNAAHLAGLDDELLNLVKEATS